MQGQRFTEKDWKLFRKKAVDWQEAHMDKLNKEYIELLSRDMNPADIHFADLEGFSDELKETVKIFIERRIF